METLIALQAWHWLVLGLALLTLEVLASTGFFIGIALASLVTSLLLWLMPTLAWHWQVTVFGLLAIVLTVAYYRVFKGVNQHTDSPLLNNRAAQLVGTRFVLDTDVDGSGSVMINDTRWHVVSETVLPKGSAVRVIATEGMTLRVDAVN